MVASAPRRRLLLVLRAAVVDFVEDLAVNPEVDRAAVEVEVVTEALLVVAAKADPAEAEAVDSRVSPAVVSSHMGPLFRGPFFVQSQHSYILLYEAPE
jgi:hypothetical protein